MWYIYTQEYYSAIKMNKIWSFVETWLDLDVDGPYRVKYVRKKKQISYINTYVWKLKTWYRLSYLQSRTRNTDVENKFMDTKGERESGVNWEIGIDIYTLLCVK